MSAPTHPPLPPQTPAGLRKFGLQFAAIFAFFAALTWWRANHPERVPIFGGISAVIAVLALVAPSAIAPLERFMIRLGERIGRITTPLILGLFYYTVVTPFGWVRRLVSGDPLNRTLAGRSGSDWIKRTDRPTAESYRQQF